MNMANRESHLQIRVLWISVDVSGEVNQVAVVINGFAFERFLEQAASTFVGSVECFCISAEEVGERAAGCHCPLI